MSRRNLREKEKLPMEKQRKLAKDQLNTISLKVGKLTDFEKDVTNEIANEEKVLSKLLVTINKKKDELEKVNTDLDSVVLKKNEENKKIADITDDAKKTITGLSNEIDTLKKDIDSKEGQYKEERERLHNLKEEVSVLSENKAKLEQDITLLTVRVNDIQIDFNAEDKKLAIKKDQVKEIERELLNSQLKYENIDKKNKELTDVKDLISSENTKLNLSQNLVIKKNKELIDVEEKVKERQAEGRQELVEARKIKDYIESRIKKFEILLKNEEAKEYFLKQLKR